MLKPYTITPSTLLSILLPSFTLSTITMEAVENSRSFKLGSNSKLAIHTNSHMVSKLKPKVRIIHIFAPEIIKTDVANFRELVQRLTGKPCETDHQINKKKTRTLSCKKFKTSHSSDANYKKVVMEQVMKDDRKTMWGGDQKCSGEFLDGFADLNSFMHDFSLASSATSSDMDNVFQDIL